MFITVDGIANRFYITQNSLEWQNRVNVNLLVATVQSGTKTLRTAYLRHSKTLYNMHCHWYSFLLSIIIIASLHNRNEAYQI